MKIVKVFNIFFILTFLSPLSSVFSLSHLQLSLRVHLVHRKSNSECKINVGESEFP